MTDVREAGAASAGEAGASAKGIARMRTALAEVWPGLRYLSLGVLLAWMYLVIDFGAWMTGSDDANLSVINVSMSVYATSAVVLFASAFAQRAFARLFALRYAATAVAGAAALGAVMLIASGPHFLQSTIASPVVFQAGSILCGVSAALMILRVGQLYCRLEPSRVLLYAVVSELLVAVIFYVVVGNAWFAPVEGAPPFGNLLAVVALPALVMFFASLPGGSGAPEGGEAAEGSGAGYTGAGAAGAGGEGDWGEAVDDAAAISPCVLLRAMPVMGKLLLAVLVFSAVASIVRNCFMFEVTPVAHQLDARQAMLLRLVLSIGLLVAAVFFFKRLSLGKLYLFGMVALALVVVALPLLGLNEGWLSLCASVLLDMINLVVWCLLSFVSKAGGLRSFLSFGLGKGCAHAGMAVGYALSYFDVLEMVRVPDGGFTAPFAAALIVAIVVCVVLIFTEKDIDALLEVSGAAHLNVRAALERSKKVVAKDGERGRPWLDACEAVGKRALLSKREQELLVDLSRNRTPQEIAEHLCITVATVRTHTHRVYAKLDVHSRSQLIELVREEYERLEGE